MSQVNLPYWVEWDVCPWHPRSPESIGVLRRRSLEISDPAAAAGNLAKAGVTRENMAVALEAVTRVRRITRWPVEKSIDFVACEMAVGGIDGPSVLLIPDLARIDSSGELSSAAARSPAG